MRQTHARPEKHGPARQIAPRRMGFPFTPEIPRHWLSGSMLYSNLANSFNLLFPLGERFFSRSVRHFLDQIEDPELLRQVGGFFGQEMQHAHEHERFFEVLEAQGYRIQGFLKLYERIGFRFLEPHSSPEVRLAVTVALEHFTAMSADRAFAQDFLDGADPVMRNLMLWHAAEEIEHKHVAFDVLRAVNPSYWLRVRGLVYATATLLGFWAAGVVVLFAQEPRIPLLDLQRDLIRAVQRGYLGRGHLLRNFLAYLRPSFHPSDLENFPVAKRFLDGLVPQARTSPEPASAAV